MVCAVQIEILQRVAEKMLEKMDETTPDDCNFVPQMHREIDSNALHLRCHFAGSAPQKDKAQWSLCFPFRGWLVLAEYHGEFVRRKATIILSSPVQALLGCSLQHCCSAVETLSILRRFEQSQNSSPVRQHQKMIMSLCAPVHAVIALTTLEK